MTQNANMSIYELSKLPGTPSRQALHQLARKSPRPAFFVGDKTDRLKINTAHDAFREYMRSHIEQILTFSQKGKAFPTSGERRLATHYLKTGNCLLFETDAPMDKMTKGSTAAELDPLTAKAVRAKARETIARAQLMEFKAQEAGRELHREAAHLVEWKLLESVFSSYIDGLYSRLKTALLDPQKYRDAVGENQPRKLKGILSQEITRQIKEQIAETKQVVNSWPVC